MANLQGRRVAIATGVLVILTLFSSGFIYRDRIEEWYRQKFKGKKVSGKSVYITEGKIPLLDFLKFLSDYTGLPVLHDSKDSSIASQEIQIAADIPEADEEMVMAILEANGIRVTREKLPGGKEVLRVNRIQGASPR